MTLLKGGVNAKHTRMQLQAQGAVGFDRKFFYSLSAD